MIWVSCAFIAASLAGRYGVASISVVTCSSGTLTDRSELRTNQESSGSSTAAASAERGIAVA